jgi:hypothetical protein
VPAEPPTVSASVLAGLAALDPDDIVLLGFPDSIWEPLDAFARLRRRIESGSAVAIGLFRSDEPERSDVPRVDERGHLTAIDIKPRDPGSSWIWGCLAARAGLLAGLQPADELSAFLVGVARREPVPTVRFGRIIDVGTRSALAAAAGHPVVASPAGTNA